MFGVAEWALASFRCSEVVEYIGVEDLSTKARTSYLQIPGKRALNISEVSRTLSFFETKSCALELHSVRYEYLSAPARHSDNGLEAIFVEYSEWYFVY